MPPLYTNIGPRKRQLTIGNQRLPDDNHPLTPDPGFPMTLPENLSAQRAAWRRDLLARRAGMDPETRARADATLAEQLRGILAGFSGVLGFTWPIKQEFDARALVTEWLAADAGRRAVLPVVLKRHTPLSFRAWTPATRMLPAGFGTSVPETGEWLTPTALLIPLVGFDAGGYRLGYGGGYYDRTLATLDPQPFKLGVAYAGCEIPSIVPQPHDIRMDVIVTETGRRQIGRTAPG
jgi:5-formyltetrahydrofolate cyclo-ligase